MGDSPAQPSTGTDELKRRLGNHAEPGHPDDQKNCDLAAMEERLLQVVYAEDDWLGPRWNENVEPCDINLLTSQQKQVAKWRGGMRLLLFRPCYIRI